MRTEDQVIAAYDWNAWRAGAKEEADAMDVIEGRTAWPRQTAGRYHDSGDVAAPMVTIYKPQNVGKSEQLISAMLMEVKP